MPQEVKQQQNRPTNPAGRRPRPKSRYGQQMEEKQSLKKTYGINERKLRNYYQEAHASTEATGETLMSLLERRLDNTVFRAGFAQTRATGRQLVSHGFMLVNGKKVNVPSYRVVEGDVIQIKESKRGKALFSLFPKSLQNVQLPVWIQLVPEEYSFKVVSLPREEGQAGVDVKSIIEFLAR